MKVAAVCYIERAVLPYMISDKISSAAPSLATLTGTGRLARGVSKLQT